jgi:hypothetical protein
VPSFSTTTVAAGTVAPLLSVTVPVILPVSAWPKITLELQKNIAITATLTLTLIISPLLIT